MRAIHYETVDSTNEAAKRLVHAGELTEPAYVLADEQTAGKGSRGRSWASPKGAGIYLSVVELPRRTIQTSDDATSTTSFTLAAGVACAEVLQEATDLDVRLKPVNDLYVDDCKLGGILTEAIVQGGMVEALIIGIGINVHPADRPVDPGVTEPTCLASLLSPQRLSRVDLNELVAKLVIKVRAWNAVVLAGDRSRITQAWEAHKLPGTTLP